MTTARPLACLALFASLACSAQPRVAPPPPAAPPVAAPAPAPRRAPIARSPFPARLVPSDGFHGDRNYPIPVDSDDFVGRVLAWGRRYEHDGHAWQFADLLLPASVDLVLREGETWHFFSPDQHFRATRYLGTPEPVQPGDRGGVGRGTGRPVRFNRDGIVGMTVPGDVLDAAFETDQIGTAIIEPGLALLTLDGGMTWQPAMPRRTGLHSVIASSRGTIVNGASGRYRRVGLTFVPDTTHLTNYDEEAMVRDGEGIHLEPTFADLGALAPTWADRAHRRVRLDARFEYDLVDDRLIERRSSANCELPVYGSPELMGCLQDGVLTVVRRTADSWSALDGLRSCGHRCVGTRDGSRFTCQGRCTETRRCDALPTFCEVRDNGERHEFAREGDTRAWTALGYDGDALVLMEGDKPLQETMVAIGNSPARRLCPDLDDPSLDILPGSTREELHLGDDGLLRVTAQRAGEAQPTLVEIDPGVRCRVVHAPEGALRRSWCGADGVAVAYRGERDPTLLRRTADTDWQPLTLPDQGANGSGVHTMRRLVPALHESRTHWLSRVNSVCSEAGVEAPRGRLLVGWNEPLVSRYLPVGADGGARSIYPLTERLGERLCERVSVPVSSIHPAWHGRVPPTSTRSTSSASFARSVGRSRSEVTRSCFTTAPSLQPR